MTTPLPNGMDALLQLKEDHRVLSELFAKYQRVGSRIGDARAALFEEIKGELGRHRILEEELFYPAFPERRMARLESASQREREHQLLDMLLSDLSALGANTHVFGIKMQILIVTFLHHSAEEERNLFPLFEALPKRTRKRVSERMRSRRQELVQESESGLAVAGIPE